MVDTKNGSVGAADTPTSITNFPAADPAVPFQFDFSGITGGANITFSF